jgi:phosphoribosylformimino-5-aminoimidazole carboxamide ribonucleotide (ProFAR) isomerase
LAFGWPGGYRNRDEINELAKAGVDHCTIWLTQSETADAVKEVEQLAKAVLG